MGCLVQVAAPGFALAVSWLTLGQTQQAPLYSLKYLGAFYTFLIFNRDFEAFLGLGLFCRSGTAFINATHPG